jgi:hypothetical protein
MKGADKQMAQHYESWMLEAARKWIRSGWSLYSFSGQHNVSSRAWAIILKETPELQPLKAEYRAMNKVTPKSLFTELKTLVDELQ